MYKKLLFIFLIFSSFLLAEEKENIDVKELSESIGHMIGKSLDDLGLQLDLKRVVKGLKKANKQKEIPINEEDCLKALAKIQKKHIEKISEKNLKEANEFLSKNSQNPDITEIEKNKLQYKITKTGNGPQVQIYNNPIIKYTGKYLDGKSFVSSEEMISLDNTIEGLKKALIGMKEHEKRTIYIHPTLGFEKSRNELLVFDVEIIKTDATDMLPENKEIATQAIKIMQ